MLKFLLVVIVVAVAVYLAVRVAQTGELPWKGARRPRLPRRPQPPARPVAPDDDEDFLRELERKRRHPEDPEAT